LAYEQKKSFLTGAIVKELYAKTFEQGIEKEDFSSVYKIFKKDLN
jgi:3-hydroxyisobutyrate dehydrogenase